ncbi:MAG: threonylcarbamoyl-AMP synthase [Firmicutes bacterium]|nr:threonylcarbamoyl-AMP synthase [Bacillota bacterium]
METKLLDVRFSEDGSPEELQADRERMQRAITEASEILKRGGLVAFPTETVYGLGGNALDPDAARAIYAAKGRPSDNPLIVHIADERQLDILTDRVSETAKKLMKAFWPGPLTMIFEKKPEVPDGTTGGLATVAVRMPDDPVTLALIRESGLCIAGPSANLSGGPSPTSWEHVYKDLNGRIDAVLQSKDSRVGIESTVLDLTGDVPTVLRPGWVTPEQITEVTGMKTELDPALLVNHSRSGVAEDRREDGINLDEPEARLLEDCKGPAPKAPGMKYKHYAPKGEMIILQGDSKAVRREAERIAIEKEAEGKKVAKLLFSDENLAEAAHTLFAELRRCDEENVDFIVASAVEASDSVGFAIMNRMLKSAGYHVVRV